MAKGKVGAPRGKRKSGGLPKPEGIPAWIEGIADRYIAASPLKDESAKESLAYAAQALLREMHAIGELRNAGEVTSVELKKFPALASNLRRILHDLKITKEREEEYNL